MIVLTVLSYNGAPADGPSASFDETGGTIGRAEQNQLVLPDPERTISRVHARVVFRGGGYAIVDNGSNPVVLNGQPLGSGREHPLNEGDEVAIGGYLLNVRRSAAPAAAADPFADLFGDASAGLAVPQAPPPPARSVMHTWTPAAPPPSAPSAWPAPSPAPALAPGQIPEDWDPFAPEAALAAPAAAPLPADPLAGLGQGVPSPSIDDLFDLGSLPPAAAPARGEPVDPLALGSELNTPMLVPREARPAPSGAVFSWDEPSRDGRVVTMPGVRSLQAPPPMPAPVPPAMPAPVPTPVPLSAAPAAPPRAPRAAAADDELLAALLRGLGAPTLRLDTLTPELMERLGLLLRESTRGAVELLVARSEFKREMRAERTMIVAQENNPLKFSPSVEVALQHLLGEAAPGFMAPVPAVRDAFDDLRAHQLGVMAGMRAALEGVLGRFDPAQLEGKLTKKSAINSLIPATRKARLWELFTELFGQLTAEAQDDFDELFGRAFLKAYEAQLDRLQQDRG